MAFASVAQSISSITNAVCGLITTGFGVSLMISQKDYTDALKSNVKAQNRIFDLSYDTQKEQLEQQKQKEQIEQELIQASPRYINGVADDQDITLLVTYLGNSFTNAYIDKDTKQAVITVSKNEQDQQLEQEAVAKLQSSNDINYGLIGLGALAVLFLLRRKN